MGLMTAAAPGRSCRPWWRPSAGSSLACAAGLWLAAGCPAFRSRVPAGLPDPGPPGPGRPGPGRAGPCRAGPCRPACSPPRTAGRPSPCLVGPGRERTFRAVCGQHYEQRYGAHGSPCSQATERTFDAKATGARVAKIVTLQTAGRRNPASRRNSINTNGTWLFIEGTRCAIAVLPPRPHVRLWPLA
jgi:hypothetical protein